MTERVLPDPGAAARTDPEIAADTQQAGAWLRALRPLWPWLVLGILSWLGWRELRGVDLGTVWVLLRDTADDLMLALLGATAVNLAIAGLYDVVALGPVSKPPRAGARWRTGVVSFSWSNFLTIGPLAGPALRLWLYRDLGVERGRARSALAAIMTSFSLGLLCWCGAAVLPLPGPLNSLRVRLLLILPIAGAVGVVVSRLAAVPWAPVVLRRWEGSKALMATVACLDWILAWVVFHLAVSGFHGGVDPVLSLRAFFLGQLVGLISFIPGGFGSADAFWLITLGGAAGGHDRMVTALILYRSIYYVLPWAFATLVLAGRLVRTSRRTASFLRSAVASYTFLCGVVLLASAATPALTHRAAFLERTVPLAIVELSHEVSVVLGFLLLVISRGLAPGYRSSHRMAVALFLSAALTTFLKGLDFEEALLALAAAVMLLVFHRSFEREGRLRPPTEFVVTVGVFAVVLFTAIGLGSVEVPELSAVFGQFDPLAHGPRFLRALLVLVSLAAVVALHFALRPRVRDPLPGPEEIDRALAEARALAHSTNALLVAGGDKAIFRAAVPPEEEEGERTSQAPPGFIAYRTAGRFLVAYSDPVCPPGSERDLLAAFLEHAAALDCDAILYQISASFLPVAHDFGFTFFKLGEEALVDLTTFDLKGNKAKTWRHGINSVEKAGCRLEIVEGEVLRPLLTELRVVSDAWLADKHISEMRFSIGRFDERYLIRFPCALVRDRLGRVVAFANVLEGPRGEEISVDLMRYHAPGEEAADLRNIMDYLFLRLMLYGKERGFRRFNLGMAPLSSVGEERWARPIERLAHSFARLGGHWYNYEGLRRFKEKFDPVWEPKYVAYQRPWDWPSAVASTAALITVGWRALLFPGGESR